MGDVGISEYTVYFYSFRFKYICYFIQIYPNSVSLLDADSSIGNNADSSAIDGIHIETEPITVQQIFVGQSSENDVAETADNSTIGGDFQYPMSITLDAGM